MTLSAAVIVVNQRHENDGLGMISCPCMEEVRFASFMVGVSTAHQKRCERGKGQAVEARKLLVQRVEMLAVDCLFDYMNDNTTNTSHTGDFYLKMEDSKYGNFDSRS